MVPKKLQKKAEASSTRTQGGFPDPDDDVNEDDFSTNVYKAAYEACRALATKGDYGDLQAVVRNAKNLKWRQLDRIVTTPQLTKLKKELSSAFTSHVLPWPNRQVAVNSEKS